jgi:hypothetical protein
MIYEMACSHNLVGAHSRAVNFYLASAEGVIGERALDREKADATGVGPQGNDGARTAAVPNRHRTGNNVGSAKGAAIKGGGNRRWLLHHR